MPALHCAGNYQPCRAPGSCAQRLGSDPVHPFPARHRATPCAPVSGCQVLRSFLFLQHFDLPSICWSSLPAAAGLALCVVAVETVRIGISRHWEDEWELAEGSDLSSHRQKPLSIKGVFLILGGWEEWELISMFAYVRP